MSCHIASYTILYYIILYYIILYYIILYYIISYRIIPYHIISYHIIYHIISYHIILYYKLILKIMGMSHLKNYWGRCEISVEGRMTVRRCQKLSLLTKHLHYMWQRCSFANILYYFLTPRSMDFLIVAESSRNPIPELMG